MSANEVVQLVNERAPSIVLLEVRGEIGAEMLIGEGKCETKSIANNDFGLFLGGAPLVVLDGGHPRVLARISPAQLGLWSFAVAIAHGAGLMLVPVYLGLCQASDLSAGHERFGALINADLGMAVLVALVHTLVMIFAGGCLAFVAYRYLGLKFVKRSWFNLDPVWALSLILTGSVSLALSFAA